MNPINVVVFSPQHPHGSVAAPRLSKFLDALEKRGQIKVQWITWNAKGVSFSEVFMADILVFQREFCQKGFGIEAIVQDAKRLGKVLVYEIDDLLTDMGQSGLMKRAKKFYNNITPEIKWLIKQVDFVTTSTETLKAELERLGGAGKTYLVPNFVDMSIWGGAVSPAPYVENGPFVLGYVGTPSHAGDLNMIRSSIAEVMKRHGPERVIFKGWGCMPVDFKFIPGTQLVRGMVHDTRQHAKEIREARIDLALAPLKDCPFNQSKSDIKFLEYSACYTPAIFSDVGPYHNGDIKHEFTGWIIPNTHTAWVNAIEELMIAHELRNIIRHAAHDHVIKNRSFEPIVDQVSALYQFFYEQGVKLKAA